MFGSTVFSALCVRCTVSFRRYNSQLKKTNVGEVIKKLNKENKSLFGELLETRPQKRKREAKKGLAFPSSAEQQPGTIQNETSSEAWWYKRTLSTSNVVHLKKNSNTYSDAKSDKLETHWEQTPETLQKQHDGDSIVKFPDETSQCSTSFLSPERSVYEASSNSNEDTYASHVTNVLGKTDKKPPVLQLPDVIVRNIPSFPLLNESKNTESMMSPESIRNILPNCKHVSNRKDYLLYPSVSKILNATMSDSSRAALRRWRLKMISELGEEGFLTHYRGLLDRGSLFHAAIHNYLSGAPESDLNLDQVQGCWQSLTDVVTNITDVRVLESHVVHSSLMYKGVIDCVAQYKGKPVLIEWKKSDKQKPDIEKTYDAPLQLSAYFGAMNYDVNYNFQVQGGLVVVAYSDGSPAHTFNMSITDCKKYWSLWLLRLKQYWVQQQQETVHSN